MSSEIRTLRVPSYRRHKPLGQAVVTLNGSDFYLGRYGTKPSKAEHQRLVGEWLAAVCLLTPALCDPLIRE